MQSALNFQGKVFLARYDPTLPERIDWVDCPTDANYRYVPSDLRVEDLFIENATDLQAKLPLSVTSFATYVSQGKRLRVRFATAGSFELLNDFTVSSGGTCAGATHFVQTISVGAYKVAEISDMGAGGEIALAGAGASGYRSDSSHHNVGMGNLDACNAPAGDAPPKDCQMPLEILLVPIGSHRAALPAPAPAGDPAPTPSAMPRLVSSPEAAGGLTHKNCFASVTPTGEPQTDLAGITQRCGPPLGLVPIGAPIMDQLAVGQPMHEYAAKLDAGACYRIFAIGGRGVEDLDTGLRAPSGDWVSKDILDDAFPTLNPDGPFCVREGGTYKLLVAVTKGSGSYAVQMWRVKQ